MPVQCKRYSVLRQFSTSLHQGGGEQLLKPGTSSAPFSVLSSPGARARHTAMPMGRASCPHSGAVVHNTLGRTAGNQHTAPISGCLQSTRPCKEDSLAMADMHLWSPSSRASEVGASTDTLRPVTWHPRAATLAITGTGSSFLESPLSTAECRDIPQSSALMWARVEAQQLRKKTAQPRLRSRFHSRIWLRDWSGARPPGYKETEGTCTCGNLVTETSRPVLTTTDAPLQCAENRREAAVTDTACASIMPKKAREPAKKDTSAQHGLMGGSGTVDLLRRQQETQRAQQRKAVQREIAEGKAQGMAAGLGKAVRQLELEQQRAQAAVTKELETKKKTAEECEEMRTILERQRAAADAPMLATHQNLTALQRICGVDPQMARLIGEQIVGRAMNGLQLAWRDRVLQATTSTDGRPVVILMEPVNAAAQQLPTTAIEQELAKLGISGARVGEAGTREWATRPQSLIIQDSPHAEPLSIPATSFDTLRLWLPSTTQTRDLMLASAESGTVNLGMASFSYTPYRQIDHKVMVGLEIDKREHSMRQMRLLLHALTATGLSTTLRESFLLSAIQDALNSLPGPAMSKLSKTISAVYLDRARKPKPEDEYHKLWKEAVLPAEGAARILLILADEAAKEELLQVSSITITLVGKGTAAGLGGLEVSATPTRLRSSETKLGIDELLGKTKAIARVKKAADSVLQRPDEFLAEAAGWARNIDGAGDMSSRLVFAKFVAEERSVWPRKQAEVFATWMQGRSTDAGLNTDDLSHDVERLAEKIEACSKEGYEVFEMRRNGSQPFAALVVGSRTAGGTDQDELARRNLRTLVPELEVYAATATLRSGGNRKAVWDDRQDSLIVAISQDGQSWLEKKWGESQSGNFRQLQIHPTTSVLIRAVNEGRESEHRQRIKKLLSDFFERGGTLSCPRMEGLDFNTTLTEIEGKCPMDQTQGAEPKHDVRTIFVALGVRREDTEHILQHIRELMNEDSVAPIVESQTSQKYRYASAAYIKIIRTMEPTVDWTMEDDRELQEQIITIVGTHFLQMLVKEIGTGIWDTFNWDTGDMLLDSMDDDRGQTVRSWLWVMRAHPFTIFQEARYGKKVVQEALQAKILVRIHKPDGWLLALADSPFLVRLEQATTDQGVKFGQSIDYNRLPYTTEDVEVLTSEIICNAMATQHVWVWKGEVPGQALGDCAMDEQHKVTKMPSLEQLIPSEAGRHSPLAFRAIKKLHETGQAVALERGYLFLVIIASRPAATPSQVHHFRLRDVFGPKLKVTGQESLTTSRKLTVDDSCNVAEELADMAREEFINKLEDALECTPKVLPGWKMRASTNDDGPWLQCGENELQHLPTNLNLVTQVHHSYLFIPHELEAVLQDGAYKVCEISGGLLVVARQHGLYEHTNNKEAFVRWNPEKQSLQELARAVASKQADGSDGGAGSGQGRSDRMQSSTAHDQLGPRAEATSAGTTTPGKDVVMDTDFGGTSTGGDALSRSPVMIENGQDGQPPPDDE